MVAEVMGRPLHARAAAVGDARHRGAGRRQGRADRQGAPLRHRRRGRRADAGPAAGPDARGQRRHRAVPARGSRRGCRRAPRLDDRCAAELHPQPGAGAAGGRARSAAPPCGWPAARSTTQQRPGVHPARRARHLRDARRRRAGGRPSPSWTWRGARAEGPLRRRRSTTSCWPSARARCARTWRRTTRTSTARWSPSSPCRCAATSRRRGGQPALRHVRAARQRPQDAARAAADGRPRRAHRARDRSAPSATAPWPRSLADAIPPALAKPMIQLGVRSGVLRKLRAGNLDGLERARARPSRSTSPAWSCAAVYPLGPVVDGVALNITVQSYRDSLFVGINACAATVPDPPGPRPGHGGRALACCAGWRSGPGSAGRGAGSHHRRAAGGHAPPASSSGLHEVAASQPTTPAP